MKRGLLKKVRNIRENWITNSKTKNPILVLSGMIPPLIVGEIFLWYYANIYSPSFQGGIDQDELSGNEVLLDSKLFQLIQISENADKLSDEYKEEHNNIPWTAIYGLRNRIVHDYGNVDIEIVYSTLKEDIPGLLEIVDEIV